MSRPDFMLIGAGRCGTTSLYHYLGQHPQIFMSPVKETNYFAWDPGRRAPPGGDDPDGRHDLRPIRSWCAYQALFAGAAPGQTTGEASPRYLRDPQAPERIWKRLPDAKLVAILRHPVERAYSAYLWYVREGVETRSFAEAVRDEHEGRNREHVSGQWHYLEAGYYHRHLSRYLEAFDPDRILVCFYEDLCRSPRELLHGLFGFLGVDPGFEPDVGIRHNPAGVPRHRLLDWLLRKRPLTTALKSALPAPLVRAVYAPAMELKRRNLVKQPIPAALRAELVAGYRGDVLRLQELVGRDLSAWLA